MKRHVIVATGLAVLSTSAFATKARMEALGQGADSFYLEDTRSIFVNPAALNNNKNFVVTEWGFQDSTFANTTEQPEGGFFREMGSFAYGLYFGNESRGQNTMRNGAAAGGLAGFSTVGDANFLHHDNALDVFFAGDMGVQWGAKLHYASNEDNSGSVAKEQSALGLGFGVAMGDIEAYANLDLKDESTGATAAGDKWEADSGLNLGAKYKHMGMNIFADYDKIGAEYTATGATAVKTEQTVIQVGASRIHDVSSTARVIFDLRYVKTDSKDTKADGTTQEVNNSQLPLIIGFETEATSWLTLRGSISQSVIINSKETKTATATVKASDNNTTNVNAGATLNFGKLKVDGRIGYNSAAGTQKKDGGLRTDEFLSTVGVSYWF